MENIDCSFDANGNCVRIGDKVTWLALDSWTQQEGIVDNISQFTFAGEIKTKVRIRQSHKGLIVIMNAEQLVKA